MWRRIMAYFLFVLGLLTLTFFRHYSGNLIPYPFLFWLTGGALFWGGFLFLRYGSSPKDLEARKRLRQLMEELKTNGEKIRVEFSGCEIKENHYTEQRVENRLFLNLGPEEQLQALQALSRNIGSDTTRQTHQSVIVFRYDNKRTGATEEFISSVIPKDSISLSFYLDRQKQTTLYVDKANRKRYHFDLDFLNA